MRVVPCCSTFSLNRAIGAIHSALVPCDIAKRASIVRCD